MIIKVSDYFKISIDELLKNGIQPVITLSHFEMPYPVEHHIHLLK